MSSGFFKINNKIFTIRDKGEESLVKRHCPRFTEYPMPNSN
jgi:hypothetical protein